MSKREIPKTYDPDLIEDRIYKMWMEKGYFHAEVNPDKRPFTIVMPPPNITGQLHMGHALDNTLQDILIRWKRMQGYETLWQPGEDHAAIATEVRVTNWLKEQGIDKHDIGRDKFLDYCWKWKEEYGGRIVNQLMKLGSSADWERERFTMDEGCSRAVETVFVDLYSKGRIYRGNRIINWCPKCQTSLSDAEVEHEEQQGFFWYINYPVSGESGRFVEIATTRPETMLGDTAVAVNPNDERYHDIVGKMLELPLTGRLIPVIEDDYVDRDFGTGCVKITPAHDPNDFEVGLRHGLEQINILNDDATMNDRCGKYAGMDRYDARERIVEDLKKEGLLVKVVPVTHSVGTHDRCHTTVEPMVKPQWFVKMDEMARAALEVVKSGNLNFVPSHFDKTYIHWLENIRDWCISRQLWWGHRIPAYYCDSCGEVVVKSNGAPERCPKCGRKHFTQDPDTLDTWFSSALWPFSTLGWPQDTVEMKYFYPTDVLVTGYDIIFFWVVRMVFSALEQTGSVPFKYVLIHGLVRDEKGRKMSKSLGNGIDPLQVIDRYGADALRLTLISGNAPGGDMRFYWERVENSRNFANKIWNATRFILMNLQSKQLTKPGSYLELASPDRWILSKANTLAREVTENMDKFELGIAVQKVYDFMWDEFCDWYIEMVKGRLRSDDMRSKEAALWTLRAVLIQGLKLLHPFMPFITEALFQSVQDDEESVMVSAWPQYREDWNFPGDEDEIGVIKDAVRAVRAVRISMNVAPSKKIKIFIVSSDAGVRSLLIKERLLLAFLCSSSEVSVNEKKIGIANDAISALIHKAAIYIPVEELVDPEKEISRLFAEKKRLEGELKRSDTMLGNEKFLSRAPDAKVEDEKRKRVKYAQLLEQVKERLTLLEGGHAIGRTQ